VVSLKVGLPERPLLPQVTASKAAPFKTRFPKRPRLVEVQISVTRGHVTHEMKLPHRPRFFQGRASHGPFPRPSRLLFIRRGRRCFVILPINRLSSSRLSSRMWLRPLPSRATVAHPVAPLLHLTHSPRRRPRRIADISKSSGSSSSSSSSSSGCVLLFFLFSFSTKTSPPPAAATRAETPRRLTTRSAATI
jgi:hypothetical protein